MLFVLLLIYCYCYCVIVDNISSESGVCDEIGRVQFKGLSVQASTAGYVCRDPGMSGFPQSYFGRILPPNDVWCRNGFGPKSHRK